MARTKPVLNVVDFENSLKQTIKPGDEVVIVTTGYAHRVRIKRGTYLGKKNDGVSCRVYEPRTRYRFTETGEDVGYSWYGDAQKRGLTPSYTKMTSGLRYDTPEYDEAYAKYRAEYEKYSARQQEVYAMYEPFEEPYYRRTTLQLNRIYKLDTSVFDLAI